MCVCVGDLIGRIAFRVSQPEASTNIDLCDRSHNVHKTHGKRNDVVRWHSGRRNAGMSTAVKTLGTRTISLSIVGRLELRSKSKVLDVMDVPVQKIYGI